jgi:hypothetical protein
MSQHKPTFVGLVLKAIACTPNRGPDGAAYEAQVLAPARAVRAVQAKLGDQPPSVEQMRELLFTLVAVLRAKRVDEEEIADRVRAVLAAAPDADLPGLPALLDTEER